MKKVGKFLVSIHPDLVSSVAAEQGIGRIEAFDNIANVINDFIKDRKPSAFISTKTTEVLSGKTVDAISIHPLENLSYIRRLKKRKNKR